MKTPTSPFFLVSERIKHHLRTFGPKEPEEILQEIRHHNPAIVPFTLWTMLFSGETKLNGFGECVTSEQFDGREYVQEKLIPVPISRPVRGPRG